MKITVSDREHLVVVDFPWVMGAGFVILPAGFLIQAAQAYGRTHIFDHDSRVGCGVAVLFLLVAAYITRRSVFSFDLVRRELEWSRTSIFGRKAGVVPFHQIKGAHLDSMRDNRGRPEYRVTLSLMDGELPLANMFWRGTPDSYQNVCDAINGALGRSPRVLSR